ncbi:conserved hypothetical protein, partial [Culex quinquefasciatus]
WIPASTVSGEACLSHLHQGDGLSIGNDKIEVPSGPVLKHGPRSLSCARANGTQLKHQRRKKHNLKLCGITGETLCSSLHPRVLYQACRSPRALGAITYRECAGCDPKDGELCLIRLKSGETLMEDRSSSDVQIDCQNWA